MLKKVISLDISQLNSLLDSDNSCVSLVRGFKSKLSLYPFHLGYLKHAIRELLDSKISKYSPELNGIILGHDNVKVVDTLDYQDNNRIFLSYVADIYLFTPAVGKVLSGVVNKKSKEHIGCLIHSAFNASIPKPRNPGDDLTSWLRTNNSVQIGHTLEFTVSKTDLNSRVPYIQGIIVRTEGDYKEEEADSAFCDDEDVGKIKKKRKSKELLENIEQDSDDYTSYHDPAQIAQLLNQEEILGKSKHRKSGKIDVDNSALLTPPVKKKIKKEKVSLVNVDDGILSPHQIKHEIDDFSPLNCVKKESSPLPTKKSKRNSLEKSVRVKTEPSVEELTASLLKEAMDNCFSPVNTSNVKKKRKSKTKDNEIGETPMNFMEDVKTECIEPLDSGRKKKKSKTMDNLSYDMPINSESKDVFNEAEDEKRSKKRKRSESPLKTGLDESFKQKKKKSRKTSLDDLTSSMLQDAIANIK